MIIKPQDPDDISILQITDTHLLADPLGRFDEVNTRDTLHQVLATMQEAEHWPPDVLLATGDLAQEPVDKTYEVLADIFDELGVPVLCLPGNHDEPDLMQQYLNRGLVTTQAYNRVGEWDIILLNSYQPGTHSGYLAESELERLEQHLSSSDSTATLIAVHHHAISIQSPWMDSMMLQNGEDFLSIIQEHAQVKAVVCGHIHQDFVSMHNHIQFIGSPSTCVQFKPGVDRFTVDEMYPGYRQLRLLTDAMLHTQVFRVPL